MSRSGYNEGCNNWELIKWRGQVASSIRGKRGQAMLKELAQALDEMLIKELIAYKLVEENGQYCALGVLGAKKGLDLKVVDPDDSEHVASLFNISEPLAREIVFENDEAMERLTPTERWKWMRNWVASQIKEE